MSRIAGPPGPIGMTKQLDTTWSTLKLTYGLVPIIAGADKFTNLLVDWKQYASPWLGNLPISASALMMIVGVIEILAGCLVLSKYTRLGAYVVSGWLVAIAANLLTTGHYFDVAVRDLVMAVGAFTLAKLSEAREPVATRAAGTPRAAVAVG
jgi:uncharacterized membrane protein YphA (DoxX/SURF4 family)